MKNLIFIVIVLIISLPRLSFSQTPKGIDSLKKYTYRVIASNPSDQNAFYYVSGFFIEHMNEILFVTSKHLFYDSLTRWRGVDFAYILFPKKNNFDTLRIPLDQQSKNIFQVDNFDLVVIQPMNISKYKKYINPIDLSINILPIDSKKGTPVLLVGFPLNSNIPAILKSKLSYDNFNKNQQQNVELFMDRVSVNGVSGAPVFINKFNGNKKVAVVIGIDQAERLTGPQKNKEVLINIAVLKNFLFKLK